MRLRFRGQARMMVGLGILGEASITARPLGGNEVDVPEGIDLLDDEQRGELATLVRDPLETAVVPPPVAAAGTSDAVELVGEAPPRSGQGATRDAWAAHAETVNAVLREANRPEVVVTAAMGRDEIINAVDQAVEAAAS